MLLDWALASLHHVLVFALTAVIAAELVLIRPGLGGAQIARLGRLDAAYGILALLVIGAGFSRLVWGLKGWEYYSANHSFWGKMIAFALVGALSVPPSLAIARWRKRQKTHVNFAVPDAEILRARRFVHAEVLLLVAILLFAAAMARGIGA